MQPPTPARPGGAGAAAGVASALLHTRLQAASAAASSRRRATLWLTLSGAAACRAPGTKDAPAAHPPWRQASTSGQGGAPAAAGRSAAGRACERPRQCPRRHLALPRRTPGPPALPHGCLPQLWSGPARRLHAASLLGASVQAPQLAPAGSRLPSVARQDSGSTQTQRHRPEPSTGGAWGRARRARSRRVDGAVAGVSARGAAGLTASSAASAPLPGVAATALWLAASSAPVSRSSSSSRFLRHALAAPQRQSCSPRGAARRGRPQRTAPFGRDAGGFALALQLPVIHQVQRAITAPVAAECLRSVRTWLRVTQEPCWSERRAVVS